MKWAKCLGFSRTVSRLGFKDCSWRLLLQTRDPADGICACESTLRVKDKIPFAETIGQNTDESALLPPSGRLAFRWDKHKYPLNMSVLIINTVSTLICFPGETVHRLRISFPHFPFLSDSRSATGSHFIYYLCNLNPYLL